MADSDYFLKLDTIDGESADDKFAGQIDLKSWSWGASNSGAMSYGGGGGAGRVNVHDFHFTMSYNKASPKLFLACASGQHIKSGTLTCRKAGGKQEPYLTYKFSDLMISSYQSGGASGGDIVPMDSIALNFAKVEIEYKIQKADGTTTQGASAGWDVKKNVKV